MATKFFLIETASDVNPGSDLERKASLTAGDGSGLKTDVANTVASGTTVQMTDTAGGTAVQWLSKPLDAVTISGTITANLWMSENNMSANVQARMDILRCNNDGTQIDRIAAGNDGVELPVTTRAAQNFTCTLSAGTITAGQRIALIVYGANIGTMASGFTFDLGYNGTTGAADGDSWVQFTETITEQAAAATSLLIPHRHRGLIVR